MQIRASAISEKRATRTLPSEYWAQKMKDETDSADRIPLAFSALPQVGIQFGPIPASGKGTMKFRLVCPTRFSTNPFSWPCPSVQKRASNR
jgi:hypothetical protein